jgi:hypothetical protein
MPALMSHIIPLVVAAAALIPLSSAALEYSASVGYLGEYRDNANRTVGSDEESDIIHRPRFAFAGDHVGPRFEAGFNYRAQQRIYQDDTFDDETILEGGADFAWNVVPDRLIVFAANQRQETEVRRSEEAVPTNLQEADESRAGVNLILDSISNHALTLGYQYAQVNLDETRNDSSRQTVTANYAIPFSETDVLSLLGDFSKVDFDDDPIPDYESRSGSLQYARLTIRSSLTISAGYQSVDRDLDRDTVDGYIGSIDFTRELSAVTSVGISLSQNFRDNSLEFGRRLIVNEPDPIDDGGFIGDTDIGEVYKEKRGAAFLSTRIGANAVSLTVDAARQEYQDVDRDADAIGAAVDVIRSIRPNLDGYLGVGYRQHDFATVQGKDDEVQGHLGLKWQRTPRLALGFSLNYFTRQRDVAERDVDDWSAQFSIDYLILGSAP